MVFPCFSYLPRGQLTEYYELLRICFVSRIDCIFSQWYNIVIKYNIHSNVYVLTRGLTCYLKLLYLV